MPASGHHSYIDHKGVVERVDSASGSIVVRISDEAECSECPAAVLCGSTGGKGHTIKVETPHASSYRKGDLVTVRGTEQMHHKAITIATVLPCIALVAVMTAIYLLTASQLAAALGGLAATVIFFVLLYLFRNKIAHEFIFRIVDTDTYKR